MASAEYSIKIHRSPQEVFEYVVNMHNLPTWSSIVIDVKDVSQPSVGREGRYTAVAKFLGKKLDSPFRLTVEEGPPLTLAAKSMGGPAPSDWRYTFKPSDGGTEFHVRVDSQPNGFFSLAEPLLMRSLRRQMITDGETLKEVLEAQAATEGAVPVTAD